MQNKKIPPDRGMDFVEANFWWLSPDRLGKIFFLKMNKFTEKTKVIEKKKKKYSMVLFNKWVNT